MNARALAGIGSALIFFPLTACSVTRPVPVALDARAVSAFLADHPHSNLRVTEVSGRRYWVRAPAVKGASLVGRRGYDVPVQRLSVPLGQVAELRASHFSWGRTGALVGGTLAAAGVALAILIDDVQPTFVFLRSPRP